MFVVLGEVLIDLVAAKESSILHSYVGGGAFNTALSLSRLNQKVGFMHPISLDLYGNRIMDYLEANNIQYYCPYRSQQATPLALSYISSSGEADYHFYRSDTADRDLEAEGLVASLPQTVGLIHIGGLSIAKQPDAKNVWKVVKAAKSQGSLVSIDPNVRGKASEDLDAYRTSVRLFIEQSDIMKISSDDVKFMYSDLTALEGFQRLCSQYKNLSLSILTQGPEDVVIYYHGEYRKIKVPVVTGIIDSIGAGDNFIAGVLYALHQNNFLTKFGLQNIPYYELQRAIAIGIEVAALGLKTAGCSPPYLDELGL